MDDPCSEGEDKKFQNEISCLLQRLNKQILLNKLLLLERQTCLQMLKQVNDEIEENLKVYRSFNLNNN